MVRASIRVMVRASIRVMVRARGRVRVRARGRVRVRVKSQSQGLGEPEIKSRIKSPKVRPDLSKYGTDIAQLCLPHSFTCSPDICSTPAYDVGIPLHMALALTPNAISAPTQALYWYLNPGPKPTPQPLQEELAEQKANLEAALLHLADHITNFNPDADAIANDVYANAHSQC